MKRKLFMSFMTREGKILKMDFFLPLWTFSRQLPSFHFTFFFFSFSLQAQIKILNLMDRMEKTTQALVKKKSTLMELEVRAKKVHLVFLSIAFLSLSLPYNAESTLALCLKCLLCECDVYFRERSFILCLCAKKGKFFLCKLSKKGKLKKFRLFRILKVLSPLYFISRILAHTHIHYRLNYL